MQRSKRPHAILAALTVAVGLILSPSCGGGSTDDTPAQATFTPLSPTPGSGTVTMQAGTSTGNTFNVRIAVKDVTGFFGTAFHVTFNPNTAAFVGRDDSTSFLRGSGISTFFAAALAAPGDVAVAATRVQNGTGTVPGVTVSDGDVIVLTFRATRSTAGNTFGFGLPREVCNNTPGCGAILTGWSGGTLTAD